MRTPLLIIALGLAVTSAQAQTYVNFIRQQQQRTNVVWDMPVAPQGTGPAALLAEEGGALFQLWTIAQQTSKDFLLDQKLVGAYLPKADVKITTRDTYAPVTRTRIDQPFTVEIQVSDLLTGTGITAVAGAPMVPDAAQLPQRLIVETVTPSGLQSQLELLAAQELTLTRSDITRSTDSVDALLSRLGVPSGPSS